MDPLPEDCKTILIAVNPLAGDGSRKRKIVELVAELATRGFEVRQNASLDELAIEAKAAQHRGELRVVIAAGGDGTIAEIANRVEKGTPLAVFPLGTENLLAKYLEMSHDVPTFADAVAAGQTAWIDAGMANGRIFLLMAGVGFDAEVVRQLHAARDGHIHHLTYVKPIFNALRTYNYPELRVSVAQPTGHWAEPIRCRWAFVFAVPRYGFGLNFAPTASATDGLLDLCAFERGGFMAGLNYLIAIVRNQHRQMAGVTVWQGEQLRIEADVEVPYELDGDPGGTLPVEIKTLPRQLRVLTAPHWSLAKPSEPPKTA